jgi:hypothetical protein
MNGVGRLVVGLSPFLGCAPAAAQEVWQADVRVQTLEVAPAGKGAVTVRIAITSDNDDDAHGTRVEILVPIGAGVVRLAPGCRPSPSPVTGLVGRVICDLGTVPVRGLREVTIALSVPPSGFSRRVGVFVGSDTPDPIPGNNYAEREVK